MTYAAFARSWFTGVCRAVKRAVRILRPASVRIGADAATDEIIAFCRQHLAKFKCPTAVEFTELPKTSTGKIQKFQLRERAKSASAIE